MRNKTAVAHRQPVGGHRKSVDWRAASRGYRRGDGIKSGYFRRRKPLEGQPRHQEVLRDLAPSIVEAHTKANPTCYLFLGPFKF